MRLSTNKVLLLVCLVNTVLSFPVGSQGAEEALIVQEGTPEGTVLVKGGCFKMGDVFGDGEGNERPLREVCVDDFFMGKYEVTVGDFRRFVEESGYRTEAERREGCFYWKAGRWEKDRNRNWRSPGFPQTETSPVVCVSWNDADAYIRWKNEKENRRYRLPTEAEWEYAARNRGKDQRYGWGNGKPSGNVADEALKRELKWSPIWEGYNDGYVYTSPVGSFQSNEIGLYDVTGNVWEWVSDFYAQDYRNLARDNPEGPGHGSARVMRGGSWDNGPSDSRVFYRYWNFPFIGSINIGFRLALPAK